MVCPAPAKGQNATLLVSAPRPRRLFVGHHEDMVVLEILALIGYSGFLSATFGWRTLQTKRATGESR